MTDRHLTLLELHLHDSEFQLGPRALGRDDEADAESEADDAAEDGSEATTSGSPALGLIALALVLVAVGVAVKRLLDGEDLESLEELDLDGE